jgi:hypothetical protein
MGEEMAAAALVEVPADAMGGGVSADVMAAQLVAAAMGAVATVLRECW